MMKELTLGIIGLGTVGSSVVKILKENQNLITNVDSLKNLISSMFFYSFFLPLPGKAADPFDLYWLS